MASLQNITCNFFKNVVFFCGVLMASMMTILVSSYQFEVGGEKGWMKPNGNEAETYNEWATRNRFHIGDTIYFKYKEDSVLVVNSSDYQTCNTLKPISKFEDGSTVFQFDRSGFFYFISGHVGHCNSGQRLIIRVMHPSEVEAPGPAPSPEGGESGGGGGGGGGGDNGGGWGIWDSGNFGPPGINSTTKLNVASGFMSVLAVVIVIFYWFI